MGVSFVGARVFRHRLLISTVLTAGVACLAVPDVALADCSAPGSIIECTGDTPTAGYGNGTQTGQTIHVNKGASVTGGTTISDAGMELGANNLINNEGAINGNKIGIVTSGPLTVQNSGKVQTAVGAAIKSGGALTLTNSAVVQGGTNGITVAGAATITNSGSILGSTLVLMTTGDLTLTNAGTISTVGNGIMIGASSGTGNGTIVNSGLIQATGTSSYAIQAGGTLSLTNSGQVFGSVSSYGSLTADNSGQIDGRAGTALSTNGLADVKNTGTITGTSGVLNSRAATIVNSGTMSSTGGGSRALAINGALTLTNTGVISGSTNGSAVNVQGAATISNTNTITALDNSITIQTSGALTLTNKGTISTGASTLNIYTTAAISAQGATNVVNDGTIATGATGPTFGLVSGGALTLANNGKIIAQGKGSVGVSAALDADVTNGGSLLATGAGSIALMVKGNAKVTNAGTISGDGFGLSTLGTGLVKNDGTISGTTAGIAGVGALDVTNNGKISGLSGLVSGGAITLVNNGSVTATGKGSVAVDAQTSVDVVNNGQITGETGIRVKSANPVGPSSIENNGTILASGGTAIQLTAAADTLSFGANSLIGGAIKTGGGGDTIDIDGSGARTRIIAFDTLKNAKVTVTGTDHWAVVGNNVVIADNSATRLLDRGLMDVRDSVGEVTRGRMTQQSARRGAADPLGGLWIQGFGGVTRGPANTTDPSYAARHAGAIAGFEDNTFEALHIGAFAGGAASTAEYKSADAQSATGTYGLGGVYARWDPGVIVVDADFVGGIASDRTRRSIVTNLTTTGTDTMSGTTKGSFISPGGGIGIRIALDDVTTITPGVHVRYLASRWGEGNETGGAGGATISNGAHTGRNLESRAQIDAEHKVRFANGVLMFYETVGALSQSQTGTAADMTIMGSAINIAAPAAQKIWGAFGTAGFEWRNAGGSSIYASLQGEWHSDKTVSARGRAGAMWRF